MPKWLLKQIEFTGGFLAGLELELPPGLTCIIGPRGSGKSTLLEGIHYGIAGTDNASRSRLDLIHANLGQAVVTIRTAAKNGDEGYTIRRAYRQPASLVTSEGKAVTSVDLDRGTFLPLDAYTSAEIEAIADESLGDKRRSLLDELKNDQFQRIQLSLAEMNRDLESNADAIRATERTIEDLTERIEELGGARAKLETLPKSTASQASLQLTAAAKQHGQNEQEDKLLKDAQDWIESIVGSLADQCRRLGTFLLLTSEQSKNASLMKKVAGLVTAATKDADEHLNVGIERLASAQDAVRKIQDQLKLQHEEQESHYTELQAADQAAGEAIKQRHDAEQAVADLKKLEIQREKVRQGLTELRGTRKTLKSQFLLEREQISDLRHEVAQSLQDDAGNKVRIKVMRNADSSGYRSTLLEALRGARVRNHDGILESLMLLRPEQLSQIIVDNDLDELQAHTSLGSKRCRRILDAYRASIDPLSLEVTHIDDRVSIELNVSSADEPFFKDASELSRGQKCTALLPLLLARRDTPLLIDQPEDNLDNHFIFETVVKSIRRLKNRRQMIFATHNANIPVLAEADLIVVLNSDGKRGLIEKAGTLDECREQIIELLEGGRQAFELRRQHYQR